MRVVSYFCDYCGKKLPNSGVNGSVTVKCGEDIVQAELCPDCSVYLRDTISKRILVTEKQIEAQMG